MGGDRQVVGGDAGLNDRIRQACALYASLGGQCGKSAAGIKPDSRANRLAASTSGETWMQVLSGLRDMKVLSDPARASSLPSMTHTSQKAST